MPINKWKHSVDIKKILYDDNLSLKEKAAGISTILQSVPITPVHPFLKMGLEIINEAGELDDVELFDDGLVYIYDWADEFKVWLGI